MHCDLVTSKKNLDFEKYTLYGIAKYIWKDLRVFQRDTMSSIAQERKRKRPAPKPALKNRNFKRAAAAYHSSSSEDEAEPLRNDKAVTKIVKFVEDTVNENEDEGVRLPNLIDASNEAKPANTIREIEAIDQSDEDDEDASLGSDVGDEDDSEGMSEDESNADASSPRKKTKRHDPSAFANSMQRILSSKLTSTKRADPVLSRSVQAQDASRTLAEQKLDAAARRKLRADKKAESEKGHQTDVLGLNREDVNTGEVVEMETRLRRTAQKGVVKLFNAVRAAQIQGLQAQQEAQGGAGKIMGMDSRKRKVDEMSKQGFLDLLASGKAG